MTWPALSGRPSLTGIPDARLVYEAILMGEVQSPSREHGTVAALREWVAERAAQVGRTAVEPEAVYQLGERLGYQVNAMWSPGEPTKFDVVFAREVGWCKFTPVLKVRWSPRLKLRAGAKAWCPLYTRQRLSLSSLMNWVHL